MSLSSLHRRQVLTTGLALALGATAGAARAEGRLRIAQQFGIVYLLLNVAQDQKLIEKAGEKLGQPIQVDWLQLSGGAVINDALLAGNVDIAAAGVGPMLTLWDRTQGRGNGAMAVKGVASLGSLPYQLLSIRPQVKTLADLGDQDRIAVPAVGVSVQSRLLQLASARQWGDAQFDKLDRLQVPLPHPDAAASLIKGGTELNAHFASPPFQEQVLAGNPNAHVVLDSYQVLGGPASATVLYATTRFRNENPKTYQAFAQALADAAALVAARPDEAVDAYLRVSGSKVDRALVRRIVTSPQVQFTLTPQKTQPLAAFMSRVGAIRAKPASAKDYFFDDAHNAGAD